LVSLEVSVLGSNVFKLASSWVNDLHIASEILVAIDFGEIAKGLVGNFGNIEFMVADSQQIVVNILEDWVGYDTIWGRCVAEARAIVQVLFKLASMPFLL
jgi:hypothetical protein